MKTRHLGEVSSIDDAVLPFEVRPLGVRGRIVRLGSVVNDIVTRHAYAGPVSALLAESVALTAMLGQSLKFEGKFILQTSSNGPLNMLVADYVTPGKVRGYARCDAEALGALEAIGGVDVAALIGKGHMGLTIDQGSDMERYQGIVPLDGASLSDAAHSYFRQSEQIPTAIRLSAGPLVGRGGMADNWRAGGIMIQHLPADGGVSPLQEHSGDLPDGREADAVEEDDRWVKARFLMQTVEDHELLDPGLTSEQLLYRLFHEDGVIVYPAQPLERYCSCSRQRLKEILQSMPAPDRSDIASDGPVEVTCEFCSTRYSFEAGEIEPG